MYSSETFGRWFWVDDNYEFKSCPLNVDGTGDFTCEDYVSEWDDWSDVDYNELFNIHKFCILNKIEYNNSLTHKEVKEEPIIINLPEGTNLKKRSYKDREKVTNKEESSMLKYEWDEEFYKQIVLDYEYRFPKFDVNNYPIHLTQH